MRGRDEATGDFLSPSRSQKRRDALAVFDLGEKLVALTDSQLAKVPMPEPLRELVRDSRRITAPVARKRQLQFLAKHMRREEDETLEAIRRSLEHDRADARRETAELHRFEAMRERLIEGGDAALAELIEAHPHADRQHLRQLARNAREERLHNKPLHAYRQLFRELKQLVDGETADFEAEQESLEELSLHDAGLDEFDLHNPDDLGIDTDDLDSVR
jgi:ribosome-associated protein